MNKITELLSQNLPGISVALVLLVLLLFAFFMWVAYQYGILRKTLNENNYIYQQMTHFQNLYEIERKGRMADILEYKNKVQELKKNCEDLAESIQNRDVVIGELKSRKNDPSIPAISNTGSPSIIPSKIYITADDLIKGSSCLKQEAVQ